jgi:hypothetical protein
MATPHATVHRWAPALGLAVLTVVLGLCSCAAHLLPQGGAQALVATEGPEQALDRIAPLRKGGSRLLYLYERGLILHEMGRYEESNNVLAKADEHYEDLYTKTLSREIASLITSDELVPYRGPIFESAFIHYYRVMNFLRADDVEGAAIECRRLSRKLQRWRDQQDSSYVDDPFLQYLTGVVYGVARERNDADVSWRAARAGYRALGADCAVAAPPGLECDLAENARALGDAPEVDGDWPACDSVVANRGDRGRVYLFIEFGSVPAKVERILTVPIYRDEIVDRPDAEPFAHRIHGRCGQAPEPHRELVELIPIALPALEEVGSRAGRGTVRVRGGGTEPHAAPAIVAADLGAHSRRAFERDYNRILIRAVARGVTKCLAREAARHKDEEERKEKEKEKEKTRENGTEEKQEERSWLGRAASWLGPRLFSWGVDAFTVVTERADVRCWSTLPGQILVARLELPPGRHALDVDLVDSDGRPLGTWTIGEVEAAAGRARVIRQRLRGLGQPIGRRPAPADRLGRDAFGIHALDATIGGRRGSCTVAPMLAP